MLASPCPKARPAKNILEKRAAQAPAAIAGKRRAEPRAAAQITHQVRGLKAHATNPAITDMCVSENSQTVCSPRTRSHTMIGFSSLPACSGTDTIRPPWRP